MGAILQYKQRKLEKFFHSNPEVAIAFSSGVDSSFLLHAALKYAKRAKAYMVKSSFQPQFELDDAIRLASELNAELQIINVNPLADEKVASNTRLRCYHCKRLIFTSILEQARKDGFHLLLDGTNASDDAGDRPGMLALQEFGVLSPLRDCGLTKAEIRQLSAEAGLSTWDKPSYSCLATRIPTGQPLDERLLQRTERTEIYLMSMGFRNFRIRTFGENAKIQITERQFPLLVQNRGKILEHLKRDYQAVLLDLETRNEQ